MIADIALALVVAVVVISTSFAVAITAEHYSRRDVVGAWTFVASLVALTTAALVAIQ